MASPSSPRPVWASWLHRERASSHAARGCSVRLETHQATDATTLARSVPDGMGAKSHSKSSIWR